MNKSELIESVAGSTGETKATVQRVIEATIDAVQDEVKKGQKVSLPGFGTFERRNRAARTARNPQTGETINVAASQVPAFKAGASFKSHVSGR